MSYCRFRNTLADLKDCADALDEMGGDLETLPDDERRAAKRLIDLCLSIGEDYSEPEDDE
jgi:hypothetical protein